MYGDTAPTLLTPSANLVTTYDANGNMTAEGIRCYEYNQANQLIKVRRCANNQTIAEYVYDYNGLRMIKKHYADGNLSNTVISWTESFETKDIVGGSTQTSVYYYANKELIAKKDHTRNKTYFHNDHLGSTSVVTNQSGTLHETTTYDPWGKVLDGGTASKFLYTASSSVAFLYIKYY